MIRSKRCDGVQYAFLRVECALIRWTRHHSVLLGALGERLMKERMIGKPPLHDVH